MLLPIFGFLRPIPALAFIPIVVIWFGIGEFAKVFVIFMTAFLHVLLGSPLVHSSSIGGTHWDALRSGPNLPGPRPTLFFAPGQAKKRSAAPPEGWGRAGLEQRIAAAWSTFVARVQRSNDPWLKLVRGSGAGAAEAAYRALLDGHADPR